MPSSCPMFGNLNDSDVTAGHTDGPLPGNAIHDQENAYGSGPRLSVNQAKLAERPAASPEIPAGIRPSFATLDE